MVSTVGTNGCLKLSLSTINICSEVEGISTLAPIQPFSLITLIFGSGNFAYAGRWTKCGGNTHHYIKHLIFEFDHDHDVKKQKPYVQ